MFAWLMSGLPSWARSNALCVLVNLVHLGHTKHTTRRLIHSNVNVMHGHVQPSVLCAASCVLPPASCVLCKASGGTRIDFLR